MAISVRYQPEDHPKSYPTLAQAQLVEVLDKAEGIYLESFRMDAIIEAIDKHFVITPRVQEEKPDETV